MPNKLKDKDLNKVTGGTNIFSDINRDLDINPSNSDIGTNPEGNALPSEINPKQTL